MCKNIAASYLKIGVALNIRGRGPKHSIRYYKLGKMKNS